MKEVNLGELTKQLVDLLTPIESEKRRRAVDAAWILLGENVQTPKPPPNSTLSAATATQHPEERFSVGATTPKIFFDQIRPSSKIEELATAARYRELHENAETHTKSDLQRIIKDARRNFDSHNFSADLRNAKNKKLFNMNTGKDKIMLSHKGQDFIDAMAKTEK